MSRFNGSARLKMAQLGWLSHFEPSRGITIWFHKFEWFLLPVLTFFFYGFSARKIPKKHLLTVGAYNTKENRRVLRLSQTITKAAIRCLSNPHLDLARLLRHMRNISP